jgi:RNA polymerase-binding transcription factor DksA
VSVDLDARRAELAALRVRLVQASEFVDLADDSGAELTSSAGDQHLADHASDTFERELDESLEENAEEIIREVDAALKAIDEGTYGTCAACGREIPEERLAAVPYATLCVEDRRKLENG